MTSTPPPPSSSTSTGRVPELVAAQRADLMLDRGDRDGQVVWMRMRRAIVELQAPATGKPN